MKDCARVVAVDGRDRRRDFDERDLDAVDTNAFTNPGPALPSISRTSAADSPFTTGSSTSGRFPAVVGTRYHLIVNASFNDGTTQVMLDTVV